MAYDVERVRRLIQETELLSDVLKHQFEQIRKDAEDQGTSPYKMKYVSGEYVLAPLLQTQASILATLVALENL